MVFAINYASGEYRSADTYDEAVKIIRSDYPQAEIGHSGDWMDGGDRTICWASWAEAEDDDGRNAIACIRPIVEQ